MTLLPLPPCLKWSNHRSQITRALSNRGLCQEDLLHQVIAYFVGLIKHGEIIKELVLILVSFMNYYEPWIDQLELLKLRFKHFSCRVERIPLSLSSLLDPTVLALVRCNGAVVAACTVRLAASTRIFCDTSTSHRCIDYHPSPEALFVHQLRNACSERVSYRLCRHYSELWFRSCCSLTLVRCDYTDVLSPSLKYLTRRTGRWSRCAHSLSPSRDEVFSECKSNGTKDLYDLAWIQSVLAAMTAISITIVLPFLVDVLANYDHDASSMNQANDLNHLNSDGVSLDLNPY